MTQDNKITDAELAKLSKMTGIGEDVILSAQVPAEKLKELHDLEKSSVFFRNATLATGLAASFGIAASIGTYAYNLEGVSGILKSAPMSVVSVFAAAAATAGVIAVRNVLHLGDPDATKEIRKAADARLVELSGKNKQNPSL